MFSRYGYTAGLEGYDSVLLNALMFSAGSRLEVVPDMTYFHPVSPDSYFIQTRKWVGLDRRSKCEMVSHVNGSITAYQYGNPPAAKHTSTLKPGQPAHINLG